jgi:chaperonin GroES
MLRPLNDQVVVEPVVSDEKGPGGLILPEIARNKYHGLRGRVVAVGPGLRTIGGEWLPINLRVDDIVILSRGGHLITEAGRTFCIISEREILAVIDDAENSYRTARPDDLVSRADGMAQKAN